MDAKRKITGAGWQEGGKQPIRISTPLGSLSLFPGICWAVGDTASKDRSLSLSSTPTASSLISNGGGPGLTTNWNCLRFYSSGFYNTWHLLMSGYRYVSIFMDYACNRRHLLSHLRVDFMMEMEHSSDGHSCIVISWWIGGAPEKLPILLDVGLPLQLLAFCCLHIFPTDNLKKKTFMVLFGCIGGSLFPRWR